MTARRIVIILHDFNRGGTERAAIRLAREWHAAGRAVTILCGSLDGGLRGAVDPHVPVIVLDPPVRRSLLSRFRLGRLMKGPLAALAPDLIFLPGNFHIPLAPGLRRAGPACVLVQKITNPTLPGGLAGLLLKPFFRHFTAAVNGFAPISEGLRRELAVLMPGTPAAVLRPPLEIDTPIPLPPRQAALQVLWAGRLEPQKDIGLALETILALNKIRPAHLTVLGGGAQREWMRRKITAMHLQDCVTHLDEVRDVAPLYAAADALLITSHYEGGPAVAVEALAQGTPVVSTDCSHLLRELLTTREAGTIVETRDPRDLAAALAGLGPRPPREILVALAAPFALPVCARAYLGWFDSLVRHDA